MSRPSIEDPPSRDPRPSPRVAHKGEADRCFARAGFTDEPEHLAGVDLERDLVDDVEALLDHIDAEIVDLDDGATVLQGRRIHSARAPRWIPIEARENPSPIRLVPIVSRPMAITGRTTPQGWISRPSRFSLIMRPQSAAGG